MEPLILHVDGFYLGPYAFSAFVCLEEKRLPFEMRAVNLHERVQKSAGTRSRSSRCRRLAERGRQARGRGDRVRS